MLPLSLLHCLIRYPFFKAPYLLFHRPHLHQLHRLLPLMIINVSIAFCSCTTAQNCMSIQYSRLTLTMQKLGAGSSFKQIANEILTEHVTPSLRENDMFNLTNTSCYLRDVFTYAFQKKFPLCLERGDHLSLSSLTLFQTAVIHTSAGALPVISSICAMITNHRQLCLFIHILCNINDTLHIPHVSLDFYCLGCA